MFTGVCLSTGGVPAPGGRVPGPRVGVWSWRVPGPRGDAWSWGASGPGGAWSQGVCSWGVSGPGGVPGPGGCLVETPLATAAGGTHPTGMHSCCGLSLKTLSGKKVKRVWLFRVQQLCDSLM